MHTSPNFTKINKISNKKKNNRSRSNFKKASLLILFLAFLLGTSFVIRNSRAEERLLKEEKSTEEKSIVSDDKKSNSSKKTDNLLLAQADTSSTTNTSNNSTNNTKTVTETIYVKNADNISFDYDSKTVEVENGNLQCKKDDRILQWHKGTREWECKKPSSSIFGNLDGDSVEVNDSGQLECKNNGDFLYWDGDDDEWACGTANGVTAILAGNGINLNGDEVSINSPNCTGSNKLQWNGNAFVCTADLDTDAQVVSFNTGTNELTISSGNTVDLSSLAGGGSSDHNTLSNLQGGTTSEYYHLTTTEHTDTLNHLTNTSNPHSVDKTDVGLGNVDNTSDLNKPISTATQNALNLKEDTTNKGSANGYAPLDSGGKVPIANLPSSIMEYQGVWNASTNTPTLADGSGDTGDVYRVSVAGTQDLGSGNVSFDIGDYAIYNGSIWEKSDTTDSVASVFSRTGIVTAQTNDYTWAQINKTTSDIADITSRSHTDLTDIGTNAHTTIDTHLASSSNPHTVTASQVGNTTAQWNADQIQGIDVDDTDIADGKILQYNSTSGNLEYETPSGGGGSSTFLGLTDTPSSFTSGSLLFTSGSSVTQDNTNLFWDDASDELQTTTIRGGDGAGDNLNLHSTSNATKGKIFLGANSVYDEVNDRLGIGTTSQTAKLEVVGNTDNPLVSFENTGNMDVWFDIKGGKVGSENWAIGAGQNAVAWYSRDDGAYRFKANNDGDVGMGGSIVGVGFLPMTGATLVAEAGGNVGISKPSSITARLHIKGSTSDDTAYSLKVDDSSNSSLLSVRNDGLATFSGVTVQGTFASAPSGVEGGIYYNSTDKHFYGYNGTSWVQLDN